MDIRGMNDEFLRSAVSIQPRLALVALGSQSARELGSRWSQVARMDYLTKPLSGDAIRSALVSALHRYLGSKHSVESQPRPAATEPVVRPAERRPVGLVADSAAMRENRCHNRQDRPVRRRCV